jgi:hypothetical protein
LFAECVGRAIAGFVAIVGEEYVLGAVAFERFDMLARVRR